MPAQGTGPACFRERCINVKNGTRLLIQAGTACAITRAAAAQPNPRLRAFFQVIGD